MLPYFGSNIRQFRKQRGWTQKTLAQKLGKQDSAISSYESDSQIPTLETVVEMADVFGISVEELILGNRSNSVSAKMLTERQRELISELICALGNPGVLSPGLSKELELLIRIHDELKR